MAAGKARGSSKSSPRSADRVPAPVERDAKACCHHEADAADTAAVRLRSAGVRLTRPRLALLQTLAEQHAPASIERIHQSVGASTCDLATVYRNLASFERAGVVRRLHFESGTALYELEASEEHHHHHVICRICRSIEPVEGCVVKPIEDAVRARGYAQVSHVVEFFGVCPACQENAAATH
jgi:Fe2+ or Zn2+ uptake regulation protein